MDPFPQIDYLHRLLLDGRYDGLLYPFSISFKCLLNDPHELLLNTCVLLKHILHHSLPVRILESFQSVQLLTEGVT